MPSLRAVHRCISGLLIGLCAVCPVWAQTPSGSALSAEEAVRLALERSPTVTAARRRLEASFAEVRRARSPFNLQAELAPGLGFTNGNALLSQRLDVSGRRGAETKRAEGARKGAEAELEAVRLHVAAEARSVYFDLARARAGEGTAQETVLLTQTLRTAVRRRVELGEAPAVQAMRAEIEVVRAEQELLRARGDVKARLSALNRLLERAPDALLPLSDALAPPDAPGPVETLSKRALETRPDIIAAQSLVEARRGEWEIARAEGRPDLYAEAAADTWSVDRNAFRSRSLGFQLRLSFPLLNGGAQRANVDRARSVIQGQEAELEAARRRAIIEIERAAVELAALREIALNYQQTILPRTEELLRATRSGFDTGLSSFLEVLEAQRVLRLTQIEYQSALYDALRARIALDRALGVMPGLARKTP